MHIGFYLASWGMFRGSGVLLQKSYRYYKNLIETISNLNPIDYYSVDVGNYDTYESKDKIKTWHEAVKSSFEHEATETQITKIMLGIFGISTAIDTYFTEYYNIYKVNNKNIDSLYERSVHLRSR